MNCRKVPVSERDFKIFWRFALKLEGGCKAFHDWQSFRRTRPRKLVFSLADFQSSLPRMALGLKVLWRSDFEWHTIAASLLPKSHPRPVKTIVPNSTFY